MSAVTDKYFESRTQSGSRTFKCVIYNGRRGYLITDAHLLYDVVLILLGKIKDLERRIKYLESL